MDEQDVKELQELAKKERELNAQIGALESLREGYRVQIRDAMEQLKQDKVELERYTVSMIRPKSGEKFSRAGLVKAGVTPDLIDKAAETVSRSPYVQVRERREAGE